jgi:co-chaperonin GroES (HSP10)
MRLLGDQLLVRKEITSVEEKSKGGIFLPIDVQEKQKKNRNIPTGEVLFAGEDTKNVKKGDRVVFVIGNTISYNYNDEDLLFIKEEHILAIL